MNIDEAIIQSFILPNDDNSNSNQYLATEREFKEFENADVDEKVKCAIVKVSKQKGHYMNSIENPE